jgi:hypothetical protein
VDNLTAFGLVAVTAMLVFYALEARSHWFVWRSPAPARSPRHPASCKGAWPFGVVEAIWAAVAVHRWHRSGSAAGCP